MPFDENDDLLSDDAADAFSIHEDEAEDLEDEEDPEKHGFHIEGEEETGTDF